VPSIGELAAGEQPQELQPVAAGLAAPRLYQASAGIERQLNSKSRVSLTEIESRGVHLANQRNINTPVNGVYPFGDPTIRLLTESSGVSRQHQLLANVNGQWHRVVFSASTRCLMARTTTKDCRPTRTICARSGGRRRMAMCGIESRWAATCRCREVERESVCGG
jgi:hypothetical protein